MSDAQIDDTQIVTDDMEIEVEVELEEIQMEEKTPMENVTTDPTETQIIPAIDIQEERRVKFGIWADTQVSVESMDNRCIIIIDNPLPDSDRITIETETAKVAALVTRSVAGALLGDSLGSQIKFFDGK